MRTVKHPKKLYIEISDEEEQGKIFGLSFSDNLNAKDKTINFNEFDDETKERALNLIGCAYMYVKNNSKKV